MTMARPDGPGSCPTGEAPDGSSSQATAIPRAERREIERLREALKVAHETNRRLNRRVQEVESGALRDKAIKDLWRAKNEKQFSTQWALQSHDRMGGAFANMKDIYIAAAEVLDLPRDGFHSVMDSAFTDPLFQFRAGPPERGEVFANVYLSKLGGVESYDIRGAVVAAIRHLQGHPVSVAAERAKRAAAQGIEARQGRGEDSVHESPVAEGDAPTQSFVAYPREGEAA